MKPDTFVKSAPLLAALVVSAAVTGFPNSARAAMFETDNFKITADFRLRGEQDWDSQDSSGVDREDRLRARVRARLGMNYQASDSVSFGTRLRSGSDDSQQSPHITIIDVDGNDTGDAQFNFDQWYLKAKRGGLSGWVGRNSFSFWTPNELFWDDDVTPAGAFAAYQFDVTDGTRLTANAAFYSLPAGMQHFSGKLAGGQLVLATKLADMGLTAAGAFYGFNADSGNANNALYLQNNGERDYSIWVGNLQAKFSVSDLPAAVGFDYMHNTEDYAAAELAGASAGVDEDDTDGYVAYATLGGLKNAGQWLAGYYYAYIEQFAVNNSFSQDDWMRWGSATQTRSSNFKGHELRGAYAFSKQLNLVGRLYLVEAISDNNDEDGNRFRLDLNYKF